MTNLLSGKGTQMMGLQVPNAITHMASAIPKTPHLRLLRVCNDHVELRLSGA